MTSRPREGGRILFFPPPYLLPESGAIAPVINRPLRLFEGLEICRNPVEVALAGLRENPLQLLLAGRLGPGAVGLLEGIVGQVVERFSAIGERDQLPSVAEDHPPVTIGDVDGPRRRMIDGAGQNRPHVLPIPLQVALLPVPGKPGERRHQDRPGDSFDRFLSTNPHFSFPDVGAILPRTPRPVKTNVAYFDRIS
jgi:hypothetical protein